MSDQTDVLLTARPAIVVQNAAKSFTGRVVVDVDELTLGNKPVEGLIGPNGAGKTTLMRMIMHSTSLDRGTITLRPNGRAGDDEVILSALPTHHMVGHGLVKSNQVIMDFDRLTIWDSLLLAAAGSRRERLYRIFDEQRVFDESSEEILRYLDVFEFSDPHSFATSAGEKKLLDILRCLLLHPRFLLLDEPTAGLPEHVTLKVMEEVRRLANQGTSVVIVEHNLDVIWNLCDEVHFMAEGHVLMTGDPQEIREHKTVVEKYLGEGHV